MLRTPAPGGAPGLLREHNEQQVLAALRDGGPASRGALATAVGLSKPTVAAVLADLEASGLVVAAGRAPGRSGPAAPLYAADPRAGLVGAVDIGRAYVRVAVADLNGQILARADEPNRARSVSALMTHLSRISEQVAAQAGTTWPELVVRVLGSPGVFDRGSDRLLLADQMPGWGRPGLTGDLRRVLGEDLVMENDINLAVVGEHARGAARNCDDVVLLSFGTGIGMGILIGGRLHRGRHGAAGEIAYLPVVLDPVVLDPVVLDPGSADAPATGDTSPAGAPPGGAPPGIESVASADAVLAEAHAAGLNARTLAEVFAAARAGDVVAAGVAARQATRIGRLVATVIALFDPDVVLIGGGLSRSLDIMRADILRVAERLAPVPPRLEAAALDDAATLVGALSTAVPLAYERLMAAHVAVRTGSTG